MAIVMDSSPSGKKDEDGHNTSIESQYIKKIDAFETYGKLLEKKRMELAREAQYEKQAQQLTKKFMEDKKVYEAAKEAAEKVRREKIFVTNLKASKESEAAQVLLDRMKREEKSQVMGMMKEQRERKFQEGEEQRQDKEEKEFFKRAGMIYVQMERQKWRDRLEEERQLLDQKMREQLQASTERQQAAKDQREAAKKANMKKLELQNAQMADRRRKDEVERKNHILEVQSARDNKVEAMRKARREKSDAASQSARELAEKAEARRKKYAEESQVRRDRIQREAAEKIQDVESRLAAERQEKEERAAGKAAERVEHREACLRRAEEQRRELQEKRTQWAEEKHSRPMAWVHSSVSQESQNETARAQKEYLQLRHEFDSQEKRMFTRKRYDALAKPAEALPPDAEDSRAARMRSLHNMYIAEKPTPKDSINYDRLPPARKQKVYGVRYLRCGLCEQDYVPDNLPGITTRATIGKLRKGWMSKTDDPQLRGSAEFEDQGVKGAPQSNSALYDKVRLCALCFQFVRQHNRTAS